jgi:rSAM/selenodomain-associated transferase 2/rSAM/selenodomain-associated transferase 1
LFILYNYTLQKQFHGGDVIKISVIIPVSREEDRINATIDSLVKMECNHSVEIIVVDGDPSGSTIQCIKEPTVITMTAEKGRAIQMNKGAARAAGDILLFLHADTTLPEKGFDKIKAVIETGKYAAGAFNYDIDSRDLFLRFIYYTSYLRSKISRIAYGDQGIFIRKDYFEKIGGYPEIPIMEEVELMKKIKKNKDKIYILKDGVKTSTRRYEEEGIIYGWLRNHRMRVLYFLGVPPERLVKYYPDTRRKKQNKCGLVLFLKYPQKGTIKTRLAKSIGDTLTLQLYECFIRDMVDKLIALPYDLHIFVAPPGKVTAMNQWLDRDLPVHGQDGRDLGERMKQTFEKMFQMGYESCVLMGSDFPDLPGSVLIDAFEGLKTAGVVIAPAADGGYYLIGFRQLQFCESIFQNVTWSTDRVFQQTMDIFKQGKVRVKVLQKWWDVDDLDEVENFMERNMKSDSKNSHTMRFLLEHKEKIFKSI